MLDLPAARSRFLARVEEFSPGQAARFAPALDALVEWSVGNGLVFEPPTGKQFQIRFRLPHERTPAWTATPRSGDGGKFSIGGPVSLHSAMRKAFAQIDGNPVIESRQPELAFTYLIWMPYRTAILELMEKMIAVPA